MARLAKIKRDTAHSPDGARLKIHNVVGLKTGFHNFMEAGGVEPYTFTTQQAQKKKGKPVINWTFHRDDDGIVVCTYRESQGAVYMFTEWQLTHLNVDIKAVMSSVKSAVHEAVKWVNEDACTNKNVKIYVKSKAELVDGNAFEHTTADSVVNGRKHKDVEWAKLTFKIPYTVTMPTGTLFDMNEFDEQKGADYHADS